MGAARLALLGGADRIELCDSDPQGGTTPSVGTLCAVLEMARATDTPVHVMIRPRAGGFVYDADEVGVMLRDAAIAVREGAHGLVLGVLTRRGEVDRTLLGRLVEVAAGRAVTFHRAVDVSTSIEAAVADAFSLGCQRVLTSGGAPTARDGAPMLARLVRGAPEGKVIMAGGGITPETVRDLVAATGVTEVHVAARRYTTSGGSPSPPGMVGVTAGAGSPWPTNGWPVPDPDTLAAIRAALDNVATPSPFGNAD